MEWIPFFVFAYLVLRLTNGETPLTLCGCCMERADGSKYRSMEKTIKCPTCRAKLDAATKGYK